MYVQLADGSTFNDFLCLDLGRLVSCNSKFEKKPTSLGFGLDRKCFTVSFTNLLCEIVYFWNFPGKFRVFSILVNLFIFGIFPENSEF